MDDDSRVIAALADPGRRALLDALRARDGQTVGELEPALAHLGRHAVLKHLGVLQDAGLIVTHKSGRTRLCYLNPVPLVGLARRWLDDFALAGGTVLADLRSAAEAKGTLMSDKPDHVYSVLIDAPLAIVWETISTEKTASFFYATTLHATLRPGADYTYTYPDGREAAKGTILAVEPPTLLDMTFQPTWDDDVAAEPGYRQVWRLSEAAGATQVTLELYGVVPGSAIAAQVVGGSLWLVSNLKTVLETGRSMG